MSMKIRCVVIAGLVVLATGTGLSSAGPGADSPEAVYAAAQEAGATKDVASLVKLTAPSERPLMALGFDMGVGMMVEFWEGEAAEQAKVRYAELQKKYGVSSGEEEEEGERFQITADTPQEEIDAHIRARAEKLYGGVDLEGYIPEIMAIVLEMPEMAEQAIFPADELTELVIDGDKATGKAGDKNISFLKEDGRWYLSSEATN